MKTVKNFFSSLFGAILSDSAILKAIKKGKIKISDFKKNYLGSNSYDCTLSKYLMIHLPEDEASAEFIKKVALNEIDPTKDDETYLKYLRCVAQITLDFKKPDNVFEFEIPNDGIYLYPELGYLGSTNEYTETFGYVPFIDGKSSVGRKFMKVHDTAGVGDDGFCGYWTLEISTKYKTKVYAYMKVAQIIYYKTKGVVLRPYNKKSDAKYSYQGPKPAPSQAHKNFK